MKRLRHPIRAIREPFGTAGLVVAVVALVAALGGSALAASGALTSKQKKEVEKIAKKFQGTGPQGPAGANGTNGTNGKDGAAGVNGTNGANGTSVTGAAATVGECAHGGVKYTSVSGSSAVCNGAPGTHGNSVKSFPIATGTSQCNEQGGVEYEVEESHVSTEVCNGKQGKDGKEGEPWTDGGTLPPNATETGAWAFTGVNKNEHGESKENVKTAISFPIPLPFQLHSTAVHFGLPQSGGAFEAGGACPSANEPGSAFEPEAAPGQLCVYEAEFFGLEGAVFKRIYRPTGGSKGAVSAGAILEFEPKEADAYGQGTFAVTGCVEKVENGEPLEECEE